MNQIDFASQASKHSAALFQHAMRYTNNSDDAADLLQDTMLKAFKYYKKFEPGSNLKGWLYTILKNTFINDYRRRTKTQDLISTADELTSADLFVSASANEAEGNFVSKDINKALKSIPAQYAKPFISYFEGYKYHEIAEELNLPIGTVKTRIHEARKLLKKYLLTYAKFNHLNASA